MRIEVTENEKTFFVNTVSSKDNDAKILGLKKAYANNNRPIPYKNVKNFCRVHRIEYSETKSFKL